MADWEEIKRLAADFQRTQTSDTLQKISERNCIDIVKKLTELQLIELIYTCDGKEFLTPAHLSREIEDEIYVNKGRMHLHDLATNLNVDYQHIENKAKELAVEKPDEYSLILGQIIHSTYKNILGKQIHDCMLINGQLSIAEFAKNLDLPSEFLLTIVNEMLPKVMDDYVVGSDERTFYTTDKMDEYKSIIAGTLAAIMKPTPISRLLKRLAIPERIFLPTVESLIKDNRLDATIENKLYIPAVYAREQNEWINKFYASNSYIGYDMLARMDIKQPEAFLKKRFPDGTQLKTCLISSNLISQVESLIEDSIASNTFIDITSVVPSALDSRDIEQLLQIIFKNNKQFKSSALIFDKTNVCSLGYIATCKDFFKNLMKVKADNDLNQGKLINHFLGGKVKSAKTKTKQQPKRNIAKSDEEESKADTRNADTDAKEEMQTEQSSATPKNEKNLSKFSDDEGQQQGKSNKKDRRKNAKVEIEDKPDESDEEDRGGKKSKSRKSGGGAQGREIKQKAVKKKYIPGNKGNQRKDADGSDEELMQSKTPRSNKGRAAKRAISPERPAQTSVSKSKGNQGQQNISSSKATEREPLIFMEADEIVEKLKRELRGNEEVSEIFYECIAKTIENELNASYKDLAKQVLDDYLKSQSEEKESESGDDDAEVDLVE